MGIPCVFSMIYPARNPELFLGKGAADRGGSAAFVKMKVKLLAAFLASD